ncbi:MAG TPA: PilZ domain-containing protein [Candidatus Binatia bacterium]|nr:PilZ domain-containing protein [Candidatus Binatia bacterium]
MAYLKVLPDNPPEAIRRRRRELRSAVVLPMFLTSGSGEKIPAVLVNISASGLLALVDVRFSPVLPLPPGARIEGDFFLDDIEIHRTLLEVVRVENHDTYLVGLSCAFVQPPAEMSAKIRAKVTSHLAAGRRQSGRQDS